jgi:hypothetical protein
MCGEADQNSFASKSLANQLADVHFTIMTHLRRARVAEVRIVRPDDGFELTGPIEMCDQIFDRLHHVAVAQIP